MSTSVAPHARVPHFLRVVGALAWVAGLAGAGCANVQAQASEPAADELTPVGILTGGMAAYVDALVADTGPWTGQRVPSPVASPRPESALRLEGEAWPVAVHGSAHDAEIGAAWLEALEAAHVLLTHDGWPLPSPDGGRGGTDGLDVYLVESLVEQLGDAEREPDSLLDPIERTRHTRRSASRLDAPWFAGARPDDGHDAAVVHALVARDVPRDRVESCALQVLASAGLFAHDPAEAEGLREATAAWLAWSYTGHFGCDEDALVRQQHASERALLAHDPRDGEGAALFIGAMAARHDGLETGFLRDAWFMARQRTREGEGLRGEPDLVRVLMQASTLAHDPMDRVVESLAVARFFAGTHEGVTGRADIPLLAQLPTDATVPVFARSTWERLPRTLRPAEHAAPLEPWGSAYARLDVRGAPSGAQLRVWLDGELGTEWSLIAVRLDAGGRERGRTRAPPTRRARGYIPLELGAGETAEVVLVVTNLPDDDDDRDAQVGASRDATIAGRLHRPGLDPDAPSPGPHGFRLIVDRGP